MWVHGDHLVDASVQEAVDLLVEITIYIYMLSIGTGEERGAYRVLVGKPEGKRPLGRPRRRWVDSIRMDLQEGDVGMWTGLGWPRIGTGGGRL